MLKPVDYLEKKLIKKIASTSINYQILEPNDNLMVAVSGGKDSYALIYLLHKLKRRLPFKITMTAVHVDQGQPHSNIDPLIKWLETSDFRYKIIKEDTFKIVLKQTAPGKNPCPVCARMRRGVLYTTAKKYDFNKVVLGHHMEDTLVTFMMNLFYSGKLQAMPPKYTTDDGLLQVIRPMIEIPVADIATLAKLKEFPVISCGSCGVSEDHKRKITEKLLNELEETRPNIKSTMLTALKNIKPSHLFDNTIPHK